MIKNNKHMKKIFTLFLFVSFAFTYQLNAQCSRTIVNDPGNGRPAYILDNDTVMSSSNTFTSWLICSGVEVIFSDNSSFNSFYIEPGGRLEFDSTFSYGYSKIYAKSGAIFDGNNKQYDTLFYETGAILEDTTVMGQFGDNINCSNTTFGYSQLPGGVGCATSSVIDNNFSAGLSVFPNPANNVVRIQWEESASVTVTLYDAKGTLLQIVNASNGFVDFDISDLNAGLYFADVFANEKHHVEKIVVE